MTGARVLAPRGADASDVGARPWDTVVADVMVSRPKVLPADASVGQVRSELLDTHVHLVLLVGATGHLVGTLTRDDVAASTPDAVLAGAVARLTGRTIRADASAAAALRGMLDAGQRRLAVVTPRGELAGLLCLKARRPGFCSDQDVARRAADGTRPPGAGRVEPLVR